MQDSKNKKVLITGISGFVGSHTAIKVLNKGYSVRGTLRDLKRAESIKSMLNKNCLSIDHLELVKGELTNPHHWDKAMEDIDYVIHIASPLPFDLKKDEDDLIIPAREGTINILYAAQKHKVKRVVLTSSVAAIGHGHENNNVLFTENDWTNVNHVKDVSPYIKSKTYAEKAAWEYVSQPNVNVELVSINPGYILGPLLEKDYSDSARLIIKIMDGKLPGVPRIGFAFVDVRDVASMHVMAMELPEAAGNRFICVNDSYWLKEVASCIKAGIPGYRNKVKSRELPDFAVKIAGIFNPQIKSILHDLGLKRNYDNSKAKKILNWQPRTNEEAILSMAESLISFNIV